MNENILELQDDIGNLIASALPTGTWQQIRFFYARAGKTSAARYQYLNTAGELDGIFPPDGLLNLMEALKGASAQPGHGTWLSVDITIDSASGEVGFNYNWDQKPEWTVEPQPENYLLDLERYPRPEAEIPAWYPKAEDYPDWQKELER